MDGMDRSQCWCYNCSSETSREEACTLSVRNLHLRWLPFFIGLAPGDFCIFSKVKTALKGRTFRKAQGINHVTPELNALPLDTSDDFFV
jgi:hypothetical protein